jgi:hypothetical protein
MWKHRRATLLTISSALLAVAPKCPICFLAYFGIFGVATASVSAYRAWLPAVTGVWLALTVATLAFQRRGKRRYGPALLGSLAALAILAGRFTLNDQALVYGGIGTLVVAVGWRVWSQTSTANDSCAQCDLQLLSDADRDVERTSGTANLGGE